MEPALLSLFLLPPPSSGTLGLARRDGACAWCATDRHEAEVVQTVVGNAVVADEREHLLACPVEQRADLDQPVMRIFGGKGRIATVH